MSGTGDESRHDTRDMTTVYLAKRTSTDRRTSAAKKNFALAINSTEAVIENKSGVYAATPVEIEALLAGYRTAIDELELLWRRQQEKGRGKGWRW